MLLFPTVCVRPLGQVNVFVPVAATPAFVTQLVVALLGLHAVNETSIELRCVQLRNI